jgi:hypothetical protein
LIHWKNFFTFEETHDLFQLKEGDLYLWDIVRFDIYLDYLWGRNKQGESSKAAWYKVAMISLPRILYLCTYLFKKSKPNLFFVNSRDRTEDGRFYDKCVDDFLKRLYPESHIIETNQISSKKYLYPVSLIHPAYILNEIYFLFYKHKDYSSLVHLINQELGVSWNNKDINRLVSDFKSEKLFYSILFRLKRTKRVYITQNGLQKALFAAAKKHHIQTVEFQHGIIDAGHLAYNYPPGVTAGSAIYIPDVFLTFSTFWGKDINYPVAETIPVGNSVLSNSTFPTDSKSCKPVLFISGDVFGQELSDLAMSYATLYPDNTIHYKLHSNEYVRTKKFVDTFSNYPNIKVLTNEYPTEYLISSCRAIVLIQSTIAYQALQLGIPVFIYKRSTYYRHAHIFNSPNVYLIDGANDIVFSKQEKQSPASNIFFEKFDESTYYRFSNSI